MPDKRQDDVLRQVLQALSADQVERAAGLIETLLDLPDLRPDTLLCLAVVRRLQGRPREACDGLRGLLARYPNHPSIRFQLGNALLDLGELQEAATHFEAAINLQPGHADALYNLGLCRVVEDAAAAGQVFLRCARLRPDILDALQQVIECAASLARAGRAAPRQRPDALPADDPDRLISVVCCSIDPARLKSLRDDLDRHMAGSAWELIHIGDASSLCEGYRRGLAQARGEILVFCHDDIRIHCEGLRARLQQHLERFDLIGPAGTTHCVGPAVAWAGPPHVHGWITHLIDGELRVGISSAMGPVVEDAQALDGLFIAGRRALFERVEWDADTFDGFHLYDVDLSYRAHLAGARLGVCADLLVEHRSRGAFGEDWQAHAQAFLRKHPDLPRQPASTLPTQYHAPVADTGQLREAYAWLQHWLEAEGHHG